jgi:16S rRNA (guanine1516-N2)-methyltransferase
MSKPTQPDDSASPATLAVCVDGTFTGRGEELACQLALPLVAPTCTDYDLLLTVTPRQLELRTVHPSGFGPVYVDFVGGSMGFSVRTGGTRLLFSAIGLSGARPLTVLDATAGLGRDAFLLALKGCRVTALERSPVVAALLQDGLERARAVPELHLALRGTRADAGSTQDKAGGLNLRVVIADARAYLESLRPADAPDVVYLDPMFPPKKKSAEVKKEMRVLRRVVGDDPDAAELLDVARRVARRHVVVKRMRLATPLGPDPTRTYPGQSTRYDVYAAAK